MEAIKDLFRVASGLPDPVLHVLIGTALYFSFVVVFRRPLHSWLPLVALLCVELLNEGFDAAQDYGSPYGISIRGSLFDIVVTMLFPVAIALGAATHRRKRLTT